MLKRTLIALGCALWSTSAHAQVDAIDLHAAVVHSSPMDVADWPVTTTINTLVMRPEGDPTPGLSFSFPTQQTWPEYVPPGFSGGIQYTVWAGVFVNGQWHVAGFILMWKGRVNTGAPILAEFATNWAYDPIRWGPMAGYQPHVGESMIFFVTAGDARGVTSVTSVRERSNVVMVSLPAGDTGSFSFPTAPPVRLFYGGSGDYNGDHKSDIIVFRPATAQWFIAPSGGTPLVLPWGMPGDIPVPADYDGDGKTDVAVFRPSNGSWYILMSSNPSAGAVVYSWGMNGDIPVPGDYDGNGKTDLGVYRPSNGTWYLFSPSTGVTAQGAWGAPTDIPVPEDFDGDGKTDVAVYRPSNSTWYIALSSSHFTSSVTVAWGAPGDIPAPADFDGDRKVNLAVYRPSNGTWYILETPNGVPTLVAYQWGQATDIPVPGDYDGDGIADIAVYRPSNGGWYIWYSSSQTSYSVQWGSATDVPLGKKP